MNIYLEFKEQFKYEKGAICYAGYTANTRCRVLEEYLESWYGETIPVYNCYVFNKNIFKTYQISYLFPEDETERVKRMFFLRLHEENVVLQNILHQYEWLERLLQKKKTL